MKTPLAQTIAATCMALAGIALPSARAATGLVTFDPPTSPQGPSIYVAVPGPQTIVTPEASFSGGVVLGLATFFPAIAFATTPNVYGTADFGHGRDDIHDAKGHFETLTSPVPESSTSVLLLAGLAALGQVSLRRRRQADTP